MSLSNKADDGLGFLARVKGSTLTRETYEILKDAIISGRLKPGQSLTQEDLAERLGVSRTPLREATRMLEGEGLIENRPWAGLTISSISPDELEELYLTRILLEGYVIREAVLKIEERDLNHLASLLERMEEAGSDEDYRELHIAHDTFHRTIYLASGLNTLCGTVEALVDRTKRFRRLYVRSNPEAKPHSQHQHRKIYEACQRRDPEAAEKALRINLLTTVIGLKQTYYQDYKLRLLTDYLEELQWIATTMTIPVGNLRNDE